jgi:sugar lactone lactonase YvrE
MPDDSGRHFGSGVSLCAASRVVNIEIFARQDDLLGECPLWCPGEQSLYWIDIGKKKLHRKTINGIHRDWELPARPGCVEQMSEGGLALIFGTSVHRFDPLTGAMQLIRPVPLVPGVRFNEGKVDPKGRLWFGSMQDTFGPLNTLAPVDRFDGALFRLGMQDITVMEERIGISNTLAWSPDGTKFYFADSLVNHISVYDWDAESGDIARKRTFFEATNLGVPDGSAMDVDGCLWNARWGAGCVLRITPDGRIDRHITIPALQTSSCAFGGPQLDQLFITSARIGMTAEALAQSPLSGSVFEITGAGQGVPTVPMNWEPSQPRSANMK